LHDIPLAALFGALFLLFLLSAFFSGSETALMALNRYRMRHKAQQGTWAPSWPRACWSARTA